MSDSTPESSEVRVVRTGCELVGRYFASPAEPALASVLITHGLGDHGGRFGNVIRGMLDAGFAVMAPDLRGNGRSGGQRGYANRFDDFLDDIEFWLDDLRQRNPTAPVFSYGHSFGGLLVLYHALLRRPALAGVVATSPSLRIAMRVPAWKVLLGRTLGRLLPRMSLRTRLDLGELSDDPAHEQNARADELMHGRITPRVWFGMMDAGRYCIEHANAFPSPLLIMHGEQDRITDAAATREFASRAPGCTWKEWPGGKHELHHMAMADEVVTFAVKWMQQALANGATQIKE